MVGPIIKATGKLLVSLLLLVFLTLHVEWPVIFQALQKTDLSLYLVATLLLLLQILLNSGKFYIFLKNTKIQRTITTIVKINLISRFYALFLPGSVGRMAARWYQITENKHERVFFLAVTVFERMLHVAVLLFLGLIPLVFYSNDREIAVLRAVVQPVAILVLTMTLIGMLYFLFPALQTSLKKIFARYVHGDGKWQSALAIFFDKFSVSLVSMPSFAVILGMNILWVVFFTLRVFILSKALGLPIYYLDMVWMSCLVLLLQILPISLAGIGVREGAYAYLFSLFGLAPEKGVILGMLLLSQMFLITLIGGVLELFRK